MFFNFSRKKKKEICKEKTGNYSSIEKYQSDANFIIFESKFLYTFKKDDFFITENESEIKGRFSIINE